MYTPKRWLRWQAVVHYLHVVSEAKFELCRSCHAHVVVAKACDWMNELVAERAVGTGTDPVELLHNLYVSQYAFQSVVHARVK